MPQKKKKRSREQKVFYEPGEYTFLELFSIMLLTSNTVVTVPMKFNLEFSSSKFLRCLGSLQTLSEIKLP